MNFARLHLPLLAVYPIRANHIMRDMIIIITQAANITLYHFFTVNEKKNNNDIGQFSNMYMYMYIHNYYMYCVNTLLYYLDTYQQISWLRRIIAFPK